VLQIGKEEVKLSLFADDMILHFKRPKDSTKKTHKADKHFCQSGGIQKSHTQINISLFTNNE
jgi:hypothetical protein